MGACVAHKRVLIVDDVISAGTAIRETVALLGAESEGTATVVGVAVSLDRQEIAVEGGSTEVLYRRSAIQQVEADLGIRVVSIAKLSHLIGYVKAGWCEMKAEVAADLRTRIEEYRSAYGVLY